MYPDKNMLLNMQIWTNWVKPCQCINLTWQGLSTLQACSETNASWGGGGVNLNSNVYGVCKYFTIIYFLKLCYFLKIKKNIEFKC